MNEMTSVNEQVEEKLMKPLLKAVNCIYIPVADPQKAAAWFEKYFGLNRVSPGGDVMLLGNGIWLFLCKCEGQTSHFLGLDGNEVVAFTFETDDIFTLHQSLTSSGTYVEPIQDYGGCGLKFNFKDPDRNKFHIWEDQTMVWLLVEGSKAGSPNLDRFAFGNPDTDVHAYLKRVIAGQPAAPRRIQFAGPSIIRKKDPQGLYELLEVLERFNRQYPEKALIITYEEE